MHIHFDGVVRHFLAPFAQVVHQLFLGHQTAGAAQQYFQQAQFARRQIDHLLVEIGAAAHLVIAERAVFDHGGAAAGAAARQGAHSCLQFGQGERLGHIIIGTEIEALDALLDGVGGRQDQHRQQRGARAQAAQHFQAAQFGQAQVEDQQVEFLGGQGRVGFLAILDAVDGIAGLAQRTGQPVGQHAVIFGK